MATKEKEGTRRRKTRKEGVTTTWTRLKMSQRERERERVKEKGKRGKNKKKERTKYLEVYPRRFFPPLLLFQSIYKENLKVKLLKERAQVSF